MTSHLENILNLIGVTNIGSILLKIFIRYTDLHSIFNTIDGKYNIDTKYYNNFTKVSYIEENKSIILLSNNNDNILLFVLKDNHSVNLILLSSNIKLFEFALSVIQNIKEQFSLEYIYVTDTLKYSVYKTPTKLDSLIKNTKDIPLYDLYILLFGKTIYDDYGFVFYDSDYNENNIYSEIHHNKNKELVKNIKVKNTNILEYIIKAIYRLNFDKKYNKNKMIELINKYRDLPICEFIGYFIMDYDIDLKIFNEIYEDLMKDLGMNSMYYMEYYKKI